jgi:FkbM family methyltransferase
MFPLYWKHLLIRTPLEQPAKRLQHFLKGWQVFWHPGLRAVHDEEREIDRLFDVVVRKDTNCIDVGAHIGSTLSAIVRRSPRGKHLAFEPVPRKAAWLRRKFPEVEVRAVALADRTGTVSFEEDHSRSGFSSIAPEGGACGGELTVACDRLDNVVDPARRVGFLKIDVEGAELLVLRGATELLHRDRPAILFESGPGGAEKFGLSREQLFNFLTVEMGYSIYLIRDYVRGAGPIDLRTFHACHVYPFRAFNYLAAT